MSFPLEGLRVLDMSRVLAGPFAGRMLSDMGADVVKLEPPEGDVTRFWGVKRAGISGYFNQQNAGKRGLCVDLGKPEGVALVKRMAAEADILIENFRPDVMGRLGIDYDVLSEINPRLIMLSISGFGANNPESRRAAYAPIIHAESGLVARQAEVSEAEPAELACSVADTNASLHGLVGLLAALHARSNTGRGEHIEMAMIDATLVTNDQMHLALDGAHTKERNEVYKTAGGPLMLAGEFRYLWKCLSEIKGVTDGLGPDATLEEKIAARRAAMLRFFNETCSNRDEVIAALNDMNIAWGDVRPLDRVGELPSVQARKSIIPVDARDGGTREIIQSPYRFRNSEAEVRGSAPYLGEHNASILGDWLGLSEAETAELSDVLIQNVPEG